MPKPKSSPPPVEVELMDTFQLLGRSWEIFKDRITTFLGIVGIIFAALIFLLLLGAGLFGVVFFTVFESGLTGFEEIGSYLLFIPAFLFVVLISLLLDSWMQVSLISATKDRQEKIGPIESFRRGWPFFVSNFLMSLLAGIAILIGFILLIIPGVILTVWFIFSKYVLVVEKTGVVEALQKSREYVRGYGWFVLGQMIALGIIYVVAALLLVGVFYILTSSMETADDLVNLVSLFIGTPFGLVFYYVLYENIKQVKQSQIKK